MRGLVSTSSSQQRLIQRPRRTGNRVSAPSAIPVRVVSTHLAWKAQSRGNLRSKATPNDKSPESDSTPSVPQMHFGPELMGSTWSNRARLSDEMLQSIMELPGTKGMLDLRSRADSLAEWKLALSKGTLPALDSVEWPQEPFKTKFADALREMEMPRFTRRYPVILNTLMKQMLTLVQDFEIKLADEESKQQDKQQKQQQQQQMGRPPPPSEDDEDQEGKDEDNEEEGQAGGCGDESQDQEMSSDQMQEAMQEMLKESGQQSPKEQKEMQVTLQQEEGDAADEENKDSELAKELESQFYFSWSHMYRAPTSISTIALLRDSDPAKAMAKVADDIIKHFQRQMENGLHDPICAAHPPTFQPLPFLGALNWPRPWRRLLMISDSELAKAMEKAAEDIVKNFQQQMEEVLETCPELRDLVRSLGRGGGKGPLRMAPEEVEATHADLGVIRSPLLPEEVRGLTRSGDLSRMLPSEMAMLAHGWPKKKRNTSSDDDVPSIPRDRTFSAEGSLNPSDSFDEEVYYLPGARSARMLHRVRRAENMLLSYERVGK
eukprot:gene14477-20501_t